MLPVNLRIFKGFSTTPQPKNTLRTMTKTVKPAGGFVNEAIIDGKEVMVVKNDGLMSFFVKTKNGAVSFKDNGKAVQIINL